MNRIALRIGLGAALFASPAFAQPDAPSEGVEVEVDEEGYMVEDPDAKAAEVETKLAELEQRLRSQRKRRSRSSR